MARRRRTKSETGVAEQIADRLQKFYFGGPAPRAASQSALARELSESRTTVTAWFARPPKIPGLLTIRRMAERHRLNPVWLLLGKGPELLGEVQPRPELGAALRAHVVADLASRSGLPDAAVEFVPSPPDELLREFVAQQRMKATEYPRILRSALAKAMQQGRGKQVQKAIAELRVWLGLKRGDSVQFRRRDVGPPTVRFVDDPLATAPLTPPGTLGPGVLDPAVYRKEAPARRAVAKRLSRAERALLKAREQSLAAGERARRSERKHAADRRTGRVLPSSPH